MPAHSPSRPRTKPPAERRDDLVSSAERLFLQQGYEQTTIEEITTGAGVAKGTFYLHFSSKPEILEALRDRFVQVLLQGVTSEVSKRQGDNWRGKLGAWARACATGYLDAASLHHLAFVATHPLSREGMSRNILIDDLAELLATGRRENAWTIDDPGFTAIFLFNALHGVVNQAGPDDMPSDRAGLLQKVEGHFLRCVLGTSELPKPVG